MSPNSLRRAAVPRAERQIRFSIAESRDPCGGDGSAAGIRARDPASVPVFL